MVYMAEITKRIIDRLRNSRNDAVCTLKWIKTAGYVVSLEKEEIQFSYRKTIYNRLP